MKKRTAALLTAALCLLLSACGVGEPAETLPPTPEPVPSVSTAPEPAPEPSEEVYDGPVNPLTGLPMEEERAAARPVAVMLNNLRDALPQQGNGEADILYEVVAEGGITRMLALYQSIDDLGVVGSVRSARPYYIELALGHDAVYVHAGGSVQAYNDLKSWDADHMDGVNGPYSYAGAGLFWRDRERIEGKRYDYEHSLITSGENLRAALDGSGFRLTHEEGYAQPLLFAEDGTPAEGETALTITVPFSSYKTGVFRYDEETGAYLAEEYGEAYVDGNDGRQVAVTNVLVLRASIRNSGDSYGHMNVDLSGGDGWFACGGKLIPITWEKGGEDDPLRYYAADGQPLVLGQGKSYVNIISSANEITWE